MSEPHQHCSINDRLCEETPEKKTINSPYLTLTINVKGILQLRTVYFPTVTAYQCVYSLFDSILEFLLYDCDQTSDNTVQVLTHVQVQLDFRNILR